MDDYNYLLLPSACVHYQENFEKEVLKLRRSLQMRRGFHSSTRDYDAERERLVSEFEELKQGHIQRINEINSDSCMSSEDKFSELKYEKAMLFEEQKSYSEAFQEINIAEAASYEGQLPQMDSDYSGGDYDIQRAVTDFESSENTTKSQDIDNGY